MEGAANEETLVGAVFGKYQQELKAKNAVDFDDLLVLTVRLLRDHADARAHWQQRFGHVMVDEFQDTNKLQLDMVGLLTAAERNICVVGDDDQSIYGWRGAEASNILDFEKHFPNPSVVKLEQNYRSTNVILGTANRLIRNNPRRHAKKLWSASGEGEKIRSIQMPDDRVEAAFITEEIERRKEEDGLKWEDVAVLYRMNAQSRLLKENLRRLQIPYRLVGGKSFFDRREVKDLLAYATCLLNADDDVALLRIINTPARGISPLTTERALELSMQEKCSLFEALRKPEFLQTLTKRTADFVTQFMTLLDDYETRLNTPLVNASPILAELMTEVGYYEDLKKSCKTPEEALSRESNVRDMIDALARYEGRATGGLRGFLDEVDLDRNREEDKKEDTPGVTLITMHAAKGLEFGHVYLIGLEEGLLPHDRSKAEGSLDEERRLLYVGITRAKRVLTLTHCRSRMKFGSASPCTASSFIKELAGDSVEQITYEKIMSTPVAAESIGSRFAQMRATVARI